MNTKQCWICNKQIATESNTANTRPPIMAIVNWLRILRAYNTRPHIHNTQHDFSHQNSIWWRDARTTLMDWMPLHDFSIIFGWYSNEPVGWTLSKMCHGRCINIWAILIVKMLAVKKGSTHYFAVKVCMVVGFFLSFRRRRGDFRMC